MYLSMYVSMYLSMYVSMYVYIGDSKQYYLSTVDIDLGVIYALSQQVCIYVSMYLII
jgi:hypothetical protein